jgi:hypothetical protein
MQASSKTVQHAKPSSGCEDHPGQTEMEQEEAFPPATLALDQTNRLFVTAASMKLANNGWGSNGLLLSSGWNWTPTNHG